MLKRLLHYESGYGEQQKLSANKTLRQPFTIVRSEKVVTAVFTQFVELLISYIQLLPASQRLYTIIMALILNL